MPRPIVVRQSRVVPGPAEVPFRVLPTLPLDAVYRHWYWVIPPIKKVVYDDGGWSRVGQRRTMVLTGGTAVAEVVLVEEPRAFGYRLSSMTGLLAPLIRYVDGRVDFEPVDGGTRLTWQWTIHPRSAASVPPVTVFALLWPGWAMKALDRMAEVVAGDSRPLGQEEA